MRPYESLIIPLILVTASCGRPPDGGRPSERMDNAPPRTAEASAPDAAVPVPMAPQSAESRAAADGPNIAPTAAPGVAFNYRYAFRLPAQRISQVQEEHAQMCERLTVARCRITGMSYRYYDERNIEASLQLKLDPTIARLFGRSGIEAVTRAEGMLTESDISGTDVGTAIHAANRSIAEMTADLARIEAQLRRTDIVGDQKSELEYQAQQLRDSIHAAREQRETNEESLATTPMVFRYGSGDYVPGYTQRPTFRQSFDRAVENFLTGVSIIATILMYLLPWLLSAALLWWVIRIVRRRWFPRATAAAEAEAG